MLNHWWGVNYQAYGKSDMFQQSIKVGQDQKQQIIDPLV